MARRLTTNQEIAGSIPAVLIFFCLSLCTISFRSDILFCYPQTSLVAFGGVGGKKCGCGGGFLAKAAIALHERWF
jgi:hypothetical protein